MNFDLQRHSSYPCDAVTRVNVSVARDRAGALTLRYLLSGPLAGLKLPRVTGSERADDLWQHTCLEAFLLAPGGAYYEFNFAPSLQWAAYRFADYRSGRTNPDVPTPATDAGMAPDGYRLSASLPLRGLPDLAPDEPWRVGLSAIIEETCGRKSYWALAHPDGEPDFHHKHCFALQLAAADRP
jgi:hypothetical protein